MNLILGGKTPPLSQDRAKALGFKILLYSTPLLYTATQAMQRAAKRLHDTGDLQSLANECVTFGDFQAMLENQHLRAYPASQSSAARMNGQGQSGVQAVTTASHKAQR